MGRIVSRCFLVLVLLAQSAAWVSAQGLNTTASKDDWEEINFEFNSSVLVDGFPSLLRLAELLQGNPSYRVRVEGHTDGIGSASFNEKLGLARATTVRDFLVKYGAQTNQMDVVSRGKSDPKVPNPNPVFSPTDVARYMNRRVVLTVMDGQGRTVGAGGAGDAIRALNAAPQTPAPPAAAAGVTDCCSEVLKRLDKLDDIARMLKDLGDQNADLRRQLDGLRANQNALEAKVNQPPPAPPKPPSATEIANEVKNELNAEKLPKFSLLSANIGEDSTGHVSATGAGRFFSPIGNTFGFQAQMEYYYLHGSREGQADIGMVDRMGKHVQAGLFSSFKSVSLTGMQKYGILGQGALTVDYIFSRGKIGLFGTQAFMTDALVNSANDVDINGNLLRNVIIQKYLHVDNQAGLGATIGLWGKTYAQGSLAYIQSSGYGDHLGGTVKLIFPLNDHFALTAEGGANETMINVGNTGRAVFGVQFGNMIRPKEYLAANHAIPMEVPRINYEVLTKRVRTGNDPPVADAGPSLSNVPAGLVTLDGSASYDPDGDPITFQWVQEAGTQVSLSSPTTAKTSFTAVAGVTYSFRLTVKDDHGGQSQARVTISTKAGDKVAIVFFTSNPAQIQPGQVATLSWNVVNADTVTISGVGNVAAVGSTPVSPTSTTTYTLTAVNTVNQLSQTTTVIVTPAGAPQIISFSSTPSQIQPGQSATLSWNVLNADTVNISGIGQVASAGATSVSPTQTTTYTLTAHNGGGDQTLTTTVVVSAQGQNPGPQPLILACFATPASIVAGQTATLNWSTSGATGVTIQPSVGAVAQSGTTSVTPAQNTTYTLTATGATGTTAASCNIAVAVTPAQAPQITRFSAIPSTITAGQTSTLLWTVTNATTVTITTAGNVALTGTQDVAPVTTTTYTLTATNATGSVTSTATVTVNPAIQPGGGGQPLISACFATPSNITAGQSATLNWATANATTVAIQPGVGTVAQSGTFTVTPAATTNYTLTATGAAGTTAATCNISVAVVAQQMPHIGRFSAIPTTIDAGQTSTLVWAVDNATTLTITPGIGSIGPLGTQDVSPTATTTYTLTATNAVGTVTATGTVTVNPVVPAPKITSFTANPQASPAAGSPVTLACTATNATTLNLGGVVFAQSNATLVVNPQQTTTYTCVASNAKGQTDSSTLTVTVPGGGGGGGGPVIVLPDSIFTTSRFIVLDASASFSPNGNTPLKYLWSSLDGQAAIASPTSAMANMWLNLGNGPWVFEVVVTDSKGNSASKQVTVRLTQGP